MMLLPNFENNSCIFGLGHKRLSIIDFVDKLQGFFKINESIQILTILPTIILICLTNII
jgi:hypothetical protein